MTKHPNFEAGFLSRLESLQGKVALVIGGHGEIARAIASTLADRGANVVLAARKVSACRELAEELAQQFGVQTLALACDVSNEDEVRATVDAVVDAFGGLDILVNNAGTSWSGAVEDMPLAGWQKCIEVNLTGSFIAARQAARVMSAADGGCIIFVASVGGLMSYPPSVAQIVPYTTSKAAIIHLTRDLAAQWAERGIRVNAIAPGQIKSGLTLTVPEKTINVIREKIPMGRLGQPYELCGAIAYLASPAASYVTGQTLVIDGGLTLV